MDRNRLYRAVVWLTISCLVVSLCLANLQGRPHYFYKRTDACYEHGWPTVFMLRPLTAAATDQEGRPIARTQPARAWRADDASHFDLVRLFCNVAVCASMVCLALVALRSGPGGSIGRVLQQIATVMFLGGALAWGWSNDVHTVGVGNINTYVLVLLLMALIVARAVLDFLHGHSLAQEKPGQLEPSR